MTTPNLSQLIDRGRTKKAHAALIAAEPDALVVSVTEREDSDRVVTRTLRLSGKWRVNSRGEISFWLDKTQDRRGVVHFGSAWRVTERNEIELSLGRDRAALGGSWDITDRHSLRYQIGRRPAESLNFRGSFGTQSILAKKGALRYQFGVEGARKRRTKTLTLFGKWVLSRDLALTFEVEYANGRKRAIRFGGDIHPSGKTSISVELTARSRRPPGVTLELTRDALGGTAFARLARTAAETRAEAGFGRTW